MQHGSLIAARFGAPLARVTGVGEITSPLMIVPSKSAPSPWGEIAGSGSRPSTRRRPDGPLVPASPHPKRKKASLEEALTIAADDKLQAEAVRDLQEASYAPSSVRVKKSMQNVWEKICEARRLQPYPVTSRALLEVAAALRAASFRSAYSYLLEAKQCHLRQGHEWPESLEISLKDCHRAVVRGIGPPCKAGIFPVELLSKLPQPPEVVHGSWPDERRSAWALAFAFLLREGELASTVLADVDLDFSSRMVKLRLSASKTDPQAKGVLRTLACTCNRGNPVTCAFCAAAHLVTHQEQRVGISRNEAGAWDVPLIGQVSTPGAFVVKESMIAALREDARFLKSKNLVAQNFDPEELSGHSFRHTGAKLLAKSGVPLELIKQLARHSSNAIEGYVEEALEECPAASSRLQEHLNFQDQLILLARKARNLEDLQESLTARVGELSGRVGEFALDEKGIRQLVLSYLQPEVILNLGTLKLHSTRGTYFTLPPYEWATACGWNWVAAGRLVQNCTSNSEIPAEANACEKCRDKLPTWALSASDSGSK